MKFHPTKFEGAWLIELTPVNSSLGYFARTYCDKEFGSLGLEAIWPQCNETMTSCCASIRGMHWQSNPFSEAKLVRCLRGSIYDVIVDVRPGSFSFGCFQSFVLSDKNLNQLYIPKGFAHGYQTLEDTCVIHYQMSSEFNAGSALGFRWNDPDISIPWPLATSEVSERDMSLPFLKEIKL